MSLRQPNSAGQFNPGTEINQQKELRQASQRTRQGSQHCLARLAPSRVQLLTYFGHSGYRGGIFGLFVATLCDRLNRTTGTTPTNLSNWTPSDQTAASVLIDRYVKNNK